MVAKNRIDEIISRLNDKQVGHTSRLFFVYISRTLRKNYVSYTDGRIHPHGKSNVQWIGLFTLASKRKCVQRNTQLPTIDQFGPVNMSE